MPDTAATGPAPPRPWAVLDTNVVLDLWLFQDPRVEPLRAAVAAGSLGVLVTAPMLAELADVLSRPFAAARPTAPAQAMAALQACSQIVDVQPRSGRSAPRCTDPDDQKFIDLAWSWPAQWLLSRDRAVLKLARPALARGLRISTPERWAATTAA